MLIVFDDYYSFTMDAYIESESSDFVLSAGPESSDGLVRWFEDGERATSFAMQIASSISTYTRQVGS